MLRDAETNAVTVTHVGPRARALEAGRAKVTASFGASYGGFIGARTQHTGADRTSQQLASWQPFGSSADADLSFGELETLVARSRDLARNNGIAQGVIQTYADNIVGPNFRLVALPDYRALGKDSAWAVAWSENVEALWRGYAESTACDVARRQTFAELTLVFLKSVFLNGAGLALPIWQNERLDKFATRIFLIEPDRLSNPQNSADTTTRRGGIDIDEYGRPLGYWIRNQHPGDVLSGMYVPGTWERVPATQAWGRKRVIHAADVDRPGQTRGKPIFSAVMQQFKMLDRYSSAELDATVTNSLIAAMIETPMDFEDLVTMLNPDGIGPNDARYINPLDYMSERAMPQNRARLRSGSLIPLYPGEKLSTFNPTGVRGGFDQFMTTTLRHIATGLHLPYELLAKDFSKTNYSSARASMLEAWRFFKSKREWLARNWARPVYTLWLEEAVNDGLVEAPNFYQNVSAYTRSRWIGAARGWVDPLKEANAASVRLEAGLTTFEAECAEQDGDWREVMAQQALEQEERKRLGLPEYAPPHTVEVPETPEEPVAGAQQTVPAEEVDV